MRPFHYQASFAIALTALALSPACGDEVAAGPDEVGGADGLTYAVVDTHQSSCYDERGSVVACAGTGQDGAYTGRQPTYTVHGDGTVTDEVTGLMWQQGLDDKMNFDDGEAYCGDMTVGGYDDWRVPTIAELYSLIDFTGRTGTGAPEMWSVPADAEPYIDTDVFEFEYGDVGAGERYIDAQWFSSTHYVSTVMGGESCAFGVNFADGRIKCYPTRDQGEGAFNFRCIRGNELYGQNDFVDNGDLTITDRATGLTWMQHDSGSLSAGDEGDGTMDWPDALDFCEVIEVGDHDDWRLPNAKELQSLVEYRRSPDTTQSAAIDPIFETTAISNEMGGQDYAYYWTSTTHLDGRVAGTDAVYVAFGRAIGQMQGVTMDVHGAGAQRGDPKTGEREDFPQLGMGPQGDARRVFNMVRCVR